MKRLMTLFSVLMLGAATVPATAMPGVYASAEQYAEADWIIMHGPTKATMYFAFGWRGAGMDGLHTIGAVGKGDCHVEKTRHFVVVMCEASGRGKELGPEQLVFDPVLRSASMTMKSGGYTHEVTWHGRGRLPYQGGQVVGGDDFVGAAAAMERDARADGHIFGHKMKSKGGWISFAFLGQGAMAMAFTGDRSLTLHDDGSYTYRVELRIPR